MDSCDHITSINFPLPAYLDIASVETLQNQVAPYLAGDQEIVLDFSETEEADACGLQWMVWLTLWVEKQGGQLRFLSINNEIRTAMSLMGLSSHLAAFIPQEVADV